MAGSVCSSVMLSQHIKNYYIKFQLPVRYNSSRISNHIGLHVHQFAGDRFRLGMVSTGDRSLSSIGISFAVYLLDTVIRILAA